MLQAVSVRLRPVLGQLSAPLTVVVVDPRGAPFKGARVTLQGQAVPIDTDSDGVAVFPSAPSGNVTAQVEVDGYKLIKQGSSDQTLFVTVPVCADGPLLTNTEIIALLSGGAMMFGGIHWKKSALQVVGELVIGAAVFNVIFRASCRW